MTDLWPNEKYDIVIFVCLAVLVGTGSFMLQTLSGSFLVDPLVLSLGCGILLRSLLGRRWNFAIGPTLAARFFIPAGIVFYALSNLDFSSYAAMPSGLGPLLFLVVAAYLGSNLLFGRLLGQKPKITYLVATGSAICGASAIAMTSPSIDGEPDDVSIALLAVTLAAFVALYLVLPFLGTLLQLPGEQYALLAGALLQFTGFVKEAMIHMPFTNRGASPEALGDLALLVKAGRYLGLVVIIPLFASLVRKKVLFPLALWLYLAAGLVGTWLSIAMPPLLHRQLTPWLETAYVLLWSIAMAAIGMNADLKLLLSDQGIKAFWMALASFCVALLTFFAYQFLFGVSWFC
ncbi:YeiH family protein [Trichloromonas sp.]|uniref:YeiH family protein n=1 Tax=Trichloromonas sp. TaxID=3069249 RepID=UPI003D812CC4